MTLESTDSALVASSSEVARSELAAGWSTPAGTRSPSRRSAIVRSVLRNPMGRVGVAIIVALFLVAFLLPPVAGGDPHLQRLSLANTKPGWLGGEGGGLFGTDAFGRDLATRMLHGLKISLLFGVLTATGAALSGLTIGLLSGFYDRTIGRVFMRIADIQFAVPFLAVGMALVAVTGPSLFRLGLILSVWAWTSFGRTIYGTVKQTKELDHITALRTHGASDVRIITRHILPAVIGPVIILWSVIAGVLILAESALSLLGIGMQPPDFSLGSMLADSKVTLRIAWWSAVFPGALIGVVVMGFSLLGDALRDAILPTNETKTFDPVLS